LSFKFPTLILHNSPYLSVTGLLLMFPAICTTSISLQFQHFLQAKASKWSLSIMPTIGFILLRLC